MHTNLGSAKLLKLRASLAHHVRIYILIIYSLACENDNIDILELVPVDLGVISLTFKHTLYTIPERKQTRYLCFPLFLTWYCVLLSN
jgi:hypothetical protein